MTDAGTYPGTDFLKRICYDAECGEVIERLEDVWVDVDSNCCVCPQHKDSTCRPASEFNATDINELQEG